MDFPEPRILPPTDWKYRAAAYQTLIHERWDWYFVQRSHNQRHAIFDFLFEYYVFRKQQLFTWSPGAGVVLETNDQSMPEGNFWHFDGAAASVIPLPAKKHRSFAWILDVLKAADHQPAKFGCNGMHEWAMVYEEDELRHEKLPLRLPHSAINAFVKKHPVACSHFDAFRFFTPAAQPLNRLQPSREQQRIFDQPGCLHVNMDLYKWASKGYPWISSELIAEALLLATDIRILDMQASPYDVSEYGLEPVKIETSAGREVYKQRQEAFSQRAEPVRRALIEAYERLLAATS